MEGNSKIHFLFLLITTFTLSINIKSQNITTTNSTSNNNTENNSTFLNVTPPIMLSKTLMSITDKCKENQMLDLINKDLRNNILETLNDMPEESSQDYCKGDHEKSCCTGDTFDVFINELELNSIPTKQKIFNKNMNIFYRIINEHSRNFINAFKFTEEQYYVNNITEITQRLVRESLLFKLNTMCNFICYPHSNGLCKVYNVTYLYNNTLYYDLNYDCEFTTNNRVSYIQKLTKTFLNEIKSMGDSIKLFYNYVNDNIEKVSALNEETLNIKNNNETFPYLNNSLNDGLYVSSITAGHYVCDNFAVYNYSNNSTYDAENDLFFMNDLVPNHKINVNASCDNVLNNICLPFECLDNFFMQFSDSSVVGLSSYLFSANLTKVSLSPYKRSTDMLAIFDNDILEKINGSIIFVSHSGYISVSRFMFSLFIIFLI